MSDAVITIDCHYERPERAAAYLIVETGRAALIDNNTVHAIPHIMAVCRREGVTPEQVEYLIPTHLHLDHAGATSALARMCPHAAIVSHPKAVRHYADPSRLVASAKSVYGEERFAALFGGIEPLPAARIRPVEDEERLAFGGRIFTFLHTRGHANHALSIHDSGSNGVFTGDTFGVEYRKSRKSQKPFLFCSTAPTDFDPVETRASVDRILALRPRALYLAHFGELEEIEEGTGALLYSLEQMERLLEEAAALDVTGGELVRFCRERIRSAILGQFDYCGVAERDADMACVDAHLDINAQGAAYAAEKRRAK